MDISKEDVEQILLKELDKKCKIHYNYMTPEKVKKLVLKTGFKIDNMKILQENDNACTYSSVFELQNDQQLQQKEKTKEKLEKQIEGLQAKLEEKQQEDDEYQQM